MSVAAGRGRVSLRVDQHQMEAGLPRDVPGHLPGPLGGGDVPGYTLLRPACRAGLPVPFGGHPPPLGQRLAPHPTPRFHISALSLAPWWYVICDTMGNFQRTFGSWEWYDLVGKPACLAWNRPILSALSRPKMLNSRIVKQFHNRQIDSQDTGSRHVRPPPINAPSS